MTGLRILASLVAAAALSAPGDAETSGAFDAKGVKIHYIVEGKGEPVLFIHGLGSSAEMNWKINGVFQAVAKDHMAIAFDLPGHGQSDKPENEEAYGLAMVEDVVLLMDHLKVQKAHVVGYSLGGIIEMKLLSLHPDRVISAVVGGMGILKEGSPLQAVWEHMGGKRNSGGAMQACMHSVAKLAMTEEEVKKIDLPVTIVAGQRDPVRMMYVVPLERIRKDWPVVEVPGAGHVDCIMKPEFKAAILDWIDKHPARPKP